MASPYNADQINAKFTREIDGPPVDARNVTQPTSFRCWCDTGRLPLVKFLNYGNGTYVIVEENVAEEDRQGGENRGRSLRRETDTSMLSLLFGDTTSRHGNSLDPIVPVGVVEPRALQETNGTTGYFVYGRRCSCAINDGEFYCPTDADLCRVWESGNFYQRGQRIIQCEGKIQDMHVRFLLPATIFGFLVLAFLLFGSRRGRHACTYLASLVFCWSNEKYTQSLQEEVEVQTRLERVRAGRSSARVVRKVAASLKTQVYQAESMQQDCMICLADFQAGDRVGKLPCKHTFHVDPCLKEWLVRKNHCPLCHAENLALPTSTPNNTEDEENSE